MEYSENLDERFAQVISEEGMFEKLCGYIACGGSPIDFAEEKRIRYSDLATWIFKSEDRRKALNEAKDMRDEWTKEVVLREMRQIAMSDIRKCFDDSGNILDVHQWPANVAKAIASIEVDDLFEGKGDAREKVGYTKKIKFWDKGKQLEALAKKLGFFVEKHEHTLGKSLEDLIVGSYKADGKS